MILKNMNESKPKFASNYPLASTIDNLRSPDGLSHPTSSARAALSWCYFDLLGCPGFKNDDVRVWLPTKCSLIYLISPILCAGISNVIHSP